MNLDDLAEFAALDSKDIYAHLDSLPEQFARAWELGLSGELPFGPVVRQGIVAAMGTSAAGAELAAAHLAGRCPAPVVIHRGADLPAWATGPETLLIVSSYLLKGSAGAPRARPPTTATRARAIRTTRTALSGQQKRERTLSDSQLNIVTSGLGLRSTGSTLPRPRDGRARSSGR